MNRIDHDTDKWNKRVLGMGVDMLGRMSGVVLVSMKGRDGYLCGEWCLLPSLIGVLYTLSNSGKNSLSHRRSKRLLWFWCIYNIYHTRNFSEGKWCKKYGVESDARGEGVIVLVSCDTFATITRACCTLWWIWSNGYSGGGVMNSSIRNISALPVYPLLLWLYAKIRPPSRGM